MIGDDDITAILVATELRTTAYQKVQQFDVPIVLFVEYTQKRYRGQCRNSRHQPIQCAIQMPRASSLKPYPHM